MSIFIHLNALYHPGIVIEVLKEYKVKAYDMIKLFCSRYEHSYISSIFEDKNQIDIGDVDIPEYDYFQIHLVDEFPDLRIYRYIHYRFFPDNNTVTEEWFERFSFFLKDWRNLMQY